MSDSGLKTNAKLWWPLASVLSFFNSGMDFYPRLARDGRATSQRTDAIVKELATAMKNWSALDASENNSDLDSAVELAKASLDEVKAQTEYQDQKATRLLTVTTFLSALSGALFAAFSSRYPVMIALPIHDLSSFIVFMAYATFLLFVLASLFGALVTFHATRTRFKYPDTATIERQDGPIRSHLFFQEIIRVTPTAWANAFVATGPEAPQARLNDKLKIAYLSNYVGETYLVAAKTADKLRYLEPAQSLLAWALRSLILFVAFVALSQAIIAPPTPETSVDPRPASSSTGPTEDVAPE